MNHSRVKQKPRDVNEETTSISLSILAFFFFFHVFGTFSLGSDLSAIVVVFLRTLGTRSRPVEDCMIEGGERGEEKDMA